MEIEEHKLSLSKSLSKIEKILCATCLGSGIALWAALSDNQFNLYDAIPLVTGLVSSFGLLTIQPYKLFLPNNSNSSYQNPSSQ